MAWANSESDSVSHIALWISTKGSTDYWKFVQCPLSYQHSIPPGHLFPMLLLSAFSELSRPRGPALISIPDPWSSADSITVLPHLCIHSLCSLVPLRLVTDAQITTPLKPKLQSAVWSDEYGGDSPSGQTESEATDPSFGLPVSFYCHGNVFFMARLAP